MFKKILSAVMALVMVLFAVIMTSADTLSDLQAEQDRLRQEAQEYQAIIDSLQGDIDKQQELVDAVAAKVKLVNDEIAVSREKIAAIEGSIEDKKSEISALEAEAEANMELFRQRLRALYVAGDVSTLEIILGASDFNDFVDKVQLIDSMNEKDSKLIDEIEAQMDDINAEVEVLNADLAVLEAEETELAAKQAELNALLSEHEEALASLYGKKEDAAGHLDAILDSQSETEQKIQDYYASQNQNNNSNNNQGVTPPGDGSWVWPAPGHYYLSSQYYEERTGYYHGGIDIAGSGFMGTTIVAAQSGTVIDSYSWCEHNWGKWGSCGCNGGWGNYVWIDHGDGKATIYAHLSYPTVYAGEYVSAGQVIGYAGSTGYSTGPHLHFEARYYGTRYDPMSEYPYM
ncbi:MAG: peptidoglycan DD-metalloendopeptidase family protein [Ruminococcus sp.]|nr:peptidoglycan DD-metalloendopeptidase family protein [Ruminococcus sp.]